MPITASRYHSVLRVSVLTLAFMLVFDSGLLSPVTKQLSDSATAYLLGNAVGVFARVEPNEINLLTAELSAKERELAAREAALNEREIAARNYDGPIENDYSTFILSAILFIITTLILINYILDWRRSRPVLV